MTLVSLAHNGSVGELDKLLNLMKGIDTIFEGVYYNTNGSPMCKRTLRNYLSSNGFGAGLISVNTLPTKEGGSYAYSL
jgi:hypothetical protein